MKLYIDGLFYKGSGIGRYYESLVKGVVGKGAIVYTCVPIKYRESFKKDFREYLDNIIPIYVNYEKFSLKGFWEQGKILKKLEKEVRVFHFPHINLPLYVPENLIVTVHDLIPFTQFWGGNYLKKSIFELFLKRALKKAKKIIAISETVKKEILDFYPVYDSKIKVIYNFIDEKFFTYQNKPATVKKNYILYVGNRKKHKNLENLIIGYNIIKDKINCKLVIAGARDKEGTDSVDNLIQKLKLNNYIVQYISPDNETLMNLYANAKLFVFPSLFEGFGLPPLEAIALGTPAITSNIEVLREILGEEIACFDPNSPNEIASSIFEAVTNQKRRETLLEIGRMRLNKYRKENIIHQYIKLYGEFR